jgi:hypothetical protein
VSLSLSAAGSGCASPPWSLCRVCAAPLPVVALAVAVATAHWVLCCAVRCREALAVRQCAAVRAGCSSSWARPCATLQCSAVC